MNLGELVAWGAKTRRFLDHPVSPNGQPLNIAKLNLTLQWLRSFDESLMAWQTLMQAADVTLTCLRRTGYRTGVAEELRQELASLPSLPTVTRFSAAIIQFVAEEAAKAREGESLLAAHRSHRILDRQGKTSGGATKRWRFHENGARDGGRCDDANEGVHRKSLCRRSHQGHRAMGSRETWPLHAILSASRPGHVACRNRSDLKSHSGEEVEF